MQEENDAKGGSIFFYDVFIAETLQASTTWTSLRGDKRVLLQFFTIGTSSKNLWWNLSKVCIRSASLSPGSVNLQIIQVLEGELLAGLASLPIS